MTRTVGTKNRSEFILDPREALRLGEALDRMGPMLLALRPKGVTRATQRVFNAIDDARQLEQARLLNSLQPPRP